MVKLKVKNVKRCCTNFINKTSGQTKGKKMSNDLQFGTEEVSLMIGVVVIMLLCLTNSLNEYCW